MNCQFFKFVLLIRFTWGTVLTVRARLVCIKAVMAGAGGTVRLLGTTSTSPDTEQPDRQPYNPPIALAAGRRGSQSEVSNLASTHLRFVSPSTCGPVDFWVARWVAAGVDALGDGAPAVFPRSGR